MTFKDVVVNDSPNARFEMDPAPYPSQIAGVHAKVILRRYAAHSCFTLRQDAGLSFLLLKP